MLFALATSKTEARPSTAVTAILGMRKADLAYDKLALDHLINPSIDQKSVAKTLDRMAATVAAMAGPGASATRKAGMVRHFLYDPGPWNDNKPFRYDLADPYGTRIENKLLGTYLRTRLGNCVSMPTLFLILADRLGANVTLSTAPLHVFVKFTDENGRVLDIETTDGGHAVKDEFYRRKLAISDKAVESGIYLAKLSREEAIALMADTVVEGLVNQGRYAEAADVASVVLKHSPHDIHALLLQGTAYARLLNVEFERRYPNPGSIPPQLRTRYELLVSQNKAAFDRAEKLGWTPDSIETSQR